MRFVASDDDKIHKQKRWFLSDATSRESAGNTQVLQEDLLFKITRGVMSVIHQNQDIRNMRCLLATRKNAQVHPLVTPVKEKEQIVMGMGMR